jgi:hypothetical protein
MEASYNVVMKRHKSNNSTSTNVTIPAITARTANSSLALSLMAV